MPLPTRLRSSTLERKRGEYQSLVDLTFAKGKDGLDQQIWHQIEIDVPRTRPGVPLWMHSSTQRVCTASHYLPMAIALTTPIYSFHSVWSVYCTSGRYDIPLVDTCKE